MKKILSAVVFCFALSAAPAFSHHPAADYVDEEIYAMIDEMVSETPHADMVFDGDMGSMDPQGGVTSEETIDEVTITTRRVRDIENMMDDGLLSYVSQLDGDVSLTLDFNADRSVTMTIMQVEE
ncbi:MAG: hypothetical protein V1706_06360 [Pseudomonadota bacterium]